MKYIVLLLTLTLSMVCLFADNSALSGLVTLDSVDPIIEINCPRIGSMYVIGEDVPISWNTIDSNTPAGCICISWRNSETSVWQPIVNDYNQTGLYNWIAPQDSTYTASIMVSMTDAFGNVGTAVSEHFSILPPRANFEANTCSGYLPLAVQFTDISPGHPVTWAWDFDGDGLIDSFEQNPGWVYDFPGDYNVSLTVTYGSETYSETRIDYITATLNPATALYVPSQYSTIQSAIDAADNGDYILVADGIYYENLQIVGKEITLASHYFLDGDSLHIDDTIIDGSQYRNRDEGSVIAIKPGTSPNLSSHIIGFTLTHGRGRSITQNQGSGQVSKIVGGGIYVESNHPILTSNKIVENDADDEGGGSYAFQSLPNYGGLVGIGRVNRGGNLFRDNHADIGKDIYIDGISFRDEIKAENCGFSVFAVQDTSVSSYWATSSSQIIYNGSYGQRHAITSDIWVATDGSNENSGTSSASPLLTLDHALSLAYGTESNPLTIHIAPGVYSPGNTGERFPLQMVSWVSLQGSGEDETFLDAEASGDMPNRVLNLDKVSGCQISDLTITGGVLTADKGINGAGIAVLDSDALLSGVTGMNLSAYGDGGCLYVLNSQVDCDDINLYNNTATSNGGAICIQSGTTNLSGSSLSQNSAHLGGGIYASESTVTISNSQIMDNTTTGSQRKGGAVYLASSDNCSIERSTIKGNSADTGAGLYLQNATNFRISANKVVNNLQSVTNFSNGGGGMYWNSSCSGLIDNNLITNNTAYQGGAGYGMSALDFRNNTIVNNRANYRGGAFYLNACSPNFHNTILWGNTAASGGNQLWLQTNSSDPVIRYSDVLGGTAAFGLSTGTYTGVYQNNLNAIPQFISPTTGVGVNFNAIDADFSLLENSPCINTGDLNTDVTNMPYDLPGSNRLSGDAVDIGAYEYQFPVQNLDPPQNVSINIENNQLIISWDRVPNANSYHIFVSDNPFGSFATEILLESGDLRLINNRYTWIGAYSQQDKQFYYVSASSEGLPARNRY